MEKINPETKVICDAGPLIHLDELGSLDLLSNFDRIIVPEVVWEEIFRPVQSNPLPSPQEP